MSELKSLLRHSSHYLTGRALVMALGLISFPIYARMFPVADYGILSLTQRIILFAAAFAKSGLQHALIRFHAEYSDSSDRQRICCSTIGFAALAFSVLAASTSALAIWQIPSGWMDPRLQRAILAATALVGLRGLQSVLMGFLRVEGRTVAFNAVDVTTKALSIVVVIAFLLKLGVTAPVFLGASAVAEGAVMIVAGALLLPRNKFSTGAIDLGFLRTSLAFAVPMIGSEVAMILLGLADRIAVHSYLGAEQLGYYSAATGLAAYVEEAIQVPLNLAITPLYMKLWAEKGLAETREFLGRALDAFVIAALGICAVCFAASRELIVFVSSAKYAQAHIFLGSLVFGYMAYATVLFFSAGFVIAKRTMRLTKIVASACALKIGLCLLLIPHFGLWGATASNVIGFVTLAWGARLASREFLHIPIRWGVWARYFLAAACAAVLAYQIPSPHALVGLALRTLTVLVSFTAALWIVSPAWRELMSCAVAYARGGRKYQAT